MSEQLYFFKFNKEIARTKLFILISKEDDSFSYKQYLLENQDKFEENLRYDNIISKIGENIELLSTEQLWSLFHWFSERTEKLYPNIEYFSSDGKTHEEMRNYGLDLFYEFDTTSQVRYFYDLLRDYDGLTDEWLGSSCRPDELNRVLNYIICYTGELTIFLNKYYYNHRESDDENLEIERLIYDINSKSNGYFHNLALSELEKSMEYNNETMQLVAKLREFRADSNDKSSYTIPMEEYEIEKRVSRLINIACLLHTATSMKEEIENYDGKIIKLHSC
ncbi:hypothetical protein [Chitinophaga sp. CF418]|uniref:hypothetical protein n=1 Tax=Chitinophaga sp. CF418 TaxID=1855287 RepID=UPI00090F0A61|nr:hypothetical protein [Chitinophaga sp. CF418]SHN41248.1 hypothetical protein SAMN05216311_112219 [Chitinophaga sp. CF418]